MKGHLVKKNQKEQKEGHGRLLNRLQWGGFVGMNKSWRSIYKRGESRFEQRKGFVIS